MDLIARAKEIVLLVTSIGLPLVFFGRHEDQPFNVTKLALLLAGVSCALALHLVQISLGYRTRGLRSILFPVAVIVLPLSVSWLASPYKEWALFGQYSRFNGLLPYLAFAVLGVLLVDAFWGRHERLVAPMAGVGALVGAYATFQALGLDPLWRPGYDVGSAFPPSTVGHFNFAGGFLAICLPFAVLMWIRVAPSWLGMGATITTAMGLVMTNSQGGWAAALAAMLILGGELSAGRRHVLRRVARLAVAALALSLVVGIVVSAGSPNPPLGGTAKTRGFLWATGLEMGANSPLVGRGPAAYAVEGLRYRKLDYVLLEKNTRADDPHSVPVAFWANTGGIGAIGFLLFAGWILWSGFRLPPRDLAGAACFAACVAYLVQALVSIDVPTVRAGLWVSLAGLTIARWAQATDGPADEPPRQRTPLLVLTWVAALFIAALGLTYSFGLMRAHHDVAIAREHFGSGDTARGTEAFERATGFRFEPHYLASYAHALGVAALDAEMAGAPLFEQMNEVNGYLRRFPEGASVLSSARLHLYRGHFDPAAFQSAEELLQMAETLDPENPEVEVTLAQVQLAAGEPSEALSVLEPLTDDLAGDVPAFWGTLATAYLLRGDEGAGQHAFEEALSLNPNDCRVLIARGLYASRNDPDGAEQLGSAIRLNCPLGDAFYLDDLIESLEDS